MNRRSVVAAAAIATGTVTAVIATMAWRSEPPPCGTGFTRTGARCCPGLAGPSSPDSSSDPGRCSVSGAACPAPLISTDHGCDESERDVVEVPSTRVAIGPSDWEAEGRVAPRSFAVERFWLDRLEVSSGRACASRVFAGAPFCRDRDRDPARAAFGVSLASAREFCRDRGGRLPTDDEWLAAAAGDRPRRYPWGETGAVCRRAAWGLDTGPCGERANGPDTVGSHPGGMTPLGIHDLAGNVAEWVESGDANRPCLDVVSSDHSSVGNCIGYVRGGSWKSSLATELRTWLRREVSSGPVARVGSGGEVGDPTIGFRCAYDRVP